MRYRKDSPAGRLLAGDEEVVGRVIRWIAVVIASPRFWALRQEREDLHQEALLRVLDSLRQGRFDPDRGLRPYVQGVARFVALERQRGLLARGRHGEPEEVTLPPTPDDSDQILTRQIVRRALDEATEDCRYLMRDYFLRERSYAEIAAARGIPIGTVKSRLFRCLRSAQEALRGVVTPPDGLHGLASDPEPGDQR